MLSVQAIDLRDRAQVRRFVDLPYRLYRGHPQWVPPIRRETLEALDPVRHPFYDHSSAGFFLAARGGRDVGRVAALEHRPFNACHGVRHVNFYFFECEDDQDVAGALFDGVLAWGRARGLTRIVGPKGFTVLDGYGVLVDGFGHRQTMTMTNYNPPHHAGLLERLGFAKDVDFASFELSKDTFVMSDRVRRVAERVARRHALRVVAFASRRALVAEARRIGELYNRAFVDNWEYAPLTEREIAFLVDKLMLVADHRLIKVIACGDELVGFLFAFPDVSAALQRMRGRLTPWGLVDVALEARRTRWVALNGAGILPEYQGRGGNALLYVEIERAIRASRFDYAELPQVAETAVQMRRDLEELGARPRKTHRVYGRDV
jgi:hypothetical protein